MLKALGIILVIFSLWLFAYIKVEVKRQRLTNLNEMKKALIHIRHELSFSMTEISLLCKKISNYTDGEVSLVFKQIQEMKEKDGGLDFFSAWQKATSKKKLFIEDAEKELENFAKDFGKKTLDIEIEKTKKCEKVFELISNEQKKKYEQDQKLIYTLTAATGAVVLILAI